MAEERLPDHIRDSNFRDTILNSKDYVASSSTSRDMYGVPLIAVIHREV